MSDTVKFADGTTLPVITILKTTAYVQGAQRDAIEIQIDKSNIAFDALNALTADSSKTKEITITDDKGSYVHDNYSFRAELAIKPVMVTPATSTAAEVDEDRLCVTLAQLTYLEVQQTAQQAQIDALTLAELGVK